MTRKKTTDAGRHLRGRGAAVMLTALIAGLALSSGCASCGKKAPPPPAGLASAPVAESAEPKGTPDSLPPQCAVVALASVDEGPSPLLVQFSAEGLCTDADGRYVWNFGDDSPLSDERNPAHTYTEPGTFQVRVTLADPVNHAEDTDELAITVTAQ